MSHVPNTPYDIPLDLELLRVGLHMEETRAIARYRLSGLEGDCFCLVRVADDDALMDLTEAIDRTRLALLAHGFLAANGPTTYAAYEWTPLRDEGYSLDGHVASVEMIPAAELNARSPLSEQQRRNVQMAFDNLDPELHFKAARLFAAHDLGSWSAFEVCSALMDRLPKEMVATLAEGGRDHLQVRELRRIAERAVELEPDGDGTLHQALGELAARRDLSAGYLRTARRIIIQTGHQFDLSWLRLDQRQLREVSYALSSGVPLPIVRLYSVGALGEFAPLAMNVITTGYLDGVQSDDFARLVNPAYDAKQLWEVEAACVAHTGGTLPTEALDLICNPALPQPVMNALRLGFTHYGLSADAVRDLLSPDVTAERIWDLIDTKGAPEEAAAEDAPETPRRGSLSDTYRSQREASDQLSPGEGHEKQGHEHEEIE